MGTTCGTVNLVQSVKSGPGVHGSTMLWAAGKAFFFPDPWRRHGNPGDLSASRFLNYNGVKVQVINDLAWAVSSGYSAAEAAVAELA